MVFARLTPADKDAFFALLDEYFASRPDLLAGGAAAGIVNSAEGRAAAASMAAHAFSATAASAGRERDAPAPPPATNGWRRPEPPAREEIGSSVGRVAAAAAALKLNAGEQTSNGAGGFPRPPPRKAPSSSGEELAAPPPEHNKLVASKKFGDVDMSSGKNLFNSLRHSTAAKHATPVQVAPPTPPAFQRKNDFAPPPRRVPSTGASSASSSRSPVPASTAPPPVPRRAAQPEPEESGEWAEAVYDYHSEDPGDLDLQEGARVLIVEKTSEDWWTGELDGQRGLVPASYVKLL